MGSSTATGTMIVSEIIDRVDSDVVKLRVALGTAMRAFMRLVDMVVGS